MGGCLLTRSEQIPNGGFETTISRPSFFTDTAAKGGYAVPFYMCDSYKRRKRDHDECSLDGTSGFEADVTYPPLTPEEIMELAEDRAALYAALDRLPPVQARRVYAHYILGRSKTGIARAENVTENAVRDSISRGVETLKILLGNLR